jgi:hypothetical protein
MCANERGKSSRTPRGDLRHTSVETDAFRAHRELMRKPIFFGLAFAIFTMAGVAAAQYPPPAPPAAPGYAYPPAGPFPTPRARFGNAGVFAFSSDINVGLVGHSQSVPNNTGDSPSDWNLTLKPSLDYFVIQGLSVGGFVEYAHNYLSVPNQNAVGSTVTNTNTFGIGARVGYNIPFVDAVSWWPMAGLGYSTTGGDNSYNSLTVSLFAPFLYHPVSHFFMGLGPVIATDLSANGANGPAAKTTTYGLQFTIGGWFLTG